MPALSNLADSFSYDAAPQYAVDAVAGVQPGTSAIRIYALNLTAQNIITMSQPFYMVGIPDFQNPIGPVPQLGGGSFYGDGFNAGGRLWSAIYRNGSIWAVHMIQDPNTPGRFLSRWYEIRANGWDGTGGSPTPTLRQVGTIDPADGLSTLMPSIAVDGSDNALISYNLVGAMQRISINRSSRCASDPLGTMPTFSQIYLSTVSFGSPGSNNLAWNDFSGTGADPVIPNRFYSHNAAVQSISQMRTWISRFDGLCGLDYSGDGLIGAPDAAAFAQAYTIGDPAADVASNGAVDGDDVQAFYELSEPQ